MIRKPKQMFRKPIIPSLVFFGNCFALCKLFDFQVGKRDQYQAHTSSIVTGTSGSGFALPCRTHLTFTFQTRNYLFGCWSVEAFRKSSNAYPAPSTDCSEVVQTASKVNKFELDPLDSNHRTSQTTIHLYALWVSGAVAKC